MLGLTSKLESPLTPVRVSAYFVQPRGHDDVHTTSRPGRAKQPQSHWTAAFFKPISMISIFPQHTNENESATY